jgi:tmRNA-binding protein
LTVGRRKRESGIKDYAQGKKRRVPFGLAQGKKKQDGRRKRK